MDFYIYKKGEFDADKLAQVDCPSDEARQAACLKYPWARVEIEPGLFCAFAKWAGWEKYLDKDALKKVITGAVCYPNEGLFQAIAIYPKINPPASKPIDNSKANADALRDYAVSVCVAIGMPEYEAMSLPLDRALSIASLAKVRLMSLSEFYSTLETEAPVVHAGRIEDFDAYLDTQNSNLRASVGL